MDLEKKTEKKEPLTSCVVVRNFKYNGKQYVKGDKIKLSKKQLEIAKKNNMI